MIKRFLIACLLLLVTSLSYAAPDNFFTNALTGGTTGCLDAIDITNDGIDNGDGAYVKASTVVYLFNYNSTSGVAESSPWTTNGVIAPDNDGGVGYSGNGRWVLAGIYAATLQSASGTSINEFSTDGAFAGNSDDAVPTEKAVNTFMGIRAPEYETIYIPAAAMVSLSTNGAAPGFNEYATNDIILDYYAFDGGATDEYVAFSMPMPENWDRSTIKIKFYWAPGDSACTAADIVTWEIAAGALANDDAIDTAVGTYIYVDDAVLVGKDADVHISAATSAMTVAGTPALGEFVHFKIRRDADASGSGTDDMVEDAWLFGAFIQFKKSNSVSAW